MATEDPINQQIEQTASQGIARASGDGESFEAISIPDLIAAEQHLAAKRAARRNHCGITFRKIVPGGCG